MVELDSTGTSEDEDVMISPDNKNELLLGASEVDTLIVDCSITASGERSDVAFSIFVIAVTSLTACSSEGSSIVEEKLVWFMVSILLVRPDDGVDTVTLIIAVVPMPSTFDTFVLIDFCVEVEFIAADAAVMFNACSGIDVEFSVLF